MKIQITTEAWTGERPGWPSRRRSRYIYTYSFFFFFLFLDFPERQRLSGL